MKVGLILSGGLGTRLTPLSSPALPKQFIKVFKNSGFQMALLRSSKLCDLTVVSVHKNYCSIVESQISELGLCHRIEIDCESSSDGTLPPVVRALIMYRKKMEKLLVLQADHHFVRENEYLQQISEELDTLPLESSILLHGIEPGEYDPGMGYFVDSQADIKARVRFTNNFIEKPAKSQFLNLSASNVIRVHAGSMILLPFAFDHIGMDRLSQLRGSVDRLIFESAGLQANYTILAGGWSDLGTFPNLYKVIQKDERGNYANMRVDFDGLADCIVLSARGGDSPQINRGGLKSNCWNLIDVEGFVHYRKYDDNF